MEFRNRRGVAVDPVPFFVVAASVLVVVYSFGPGYLTALNVPLPWALGVCTTICSGLLSAAYYRLVWTTEPAKRGVVPAAARLRTLFYTILTGIALLALLSLPLLV